jgi:hypothetical protein
MTTATTQYVRDHLSDTNEAIRAAYHAEPRRYQPVNAKAILNWLGDRARLVRLNAFAASAVPNGLTAEQADLYAVLQSAALTLVLATANPETSIDLTPGRKHMAMLMGFVGFGVLDAAEDAAPLVAMALVPEWDEELTLEQIADVRSAKLAEDAAQTLANRAASLASWVVSQSTAPTGEQVKARWEATA